MPIYFSLRPLGTWKLQREFYSVILTMYHLEACSDEEYLSEEELRVSVQRNIIITFKNSNLLLSTFQPLCHLNVHILRGAWREPMKTLKNKNKNKIYIYIYYTYFILIFISQFFSFLQSYDVPFTYQLYLDIDIVTRSLHESCQTSRYLSRFLTTLIHKDLLSRGPKLES